MENNKGPLKTYKLNPGVLIFLVSAGSFFCVLFLSKLLDFSYHPAPIFVTMSLEGSILSLLLLLALCLVSGRVILWAYSRIQPLERPRRIFVYGVLLTLAIAFISEGLLYLPQRFLWRQLNAHLSDLGVSPGYPNYFLLWFRPVLFGCVATTLTLLWIARWKKTGEPPAALFSSATWKQDALLVIATLVTYGLVMRVLVEFILFVASFFRIRWG